MAGLIFVTAFILMSDQSSQLFVLVDERQGIVLELLRTTGYHFFNIKFVDDINSLDGFMTLVIIFCYFDVKS